MSSIIEDPGIPLVGMNGSQKLYTSSSDLSINMKSKKEETVGTRLARRKTLFYKRKRTCDITLALALFGIFFMVIETELTAAKVIHREETPSYLFKICITLSTVALLTFICLYHKYDIQIYVIDNTVDDWRVAISNERILKIVVEFCVCLIHPIPGNVLIQWKLTTAHKGDDGKLVWIPLDVVLSLPMILRLYLICRAIMLHSKLYEDASSQSLGALNRINFNFRFIFKSLMALYPDYILTVIMVTLFVIASWVLRLCEMYNDSIHANFLNTMWVIAITFLSVGFGDIVPTSHCGRGVTVITGIMGAGCTALVVAVLARKLELSRAEKYVHDFVIDVDLVKKMKHQAANVVKAGWMVYKLRKAKGSVRKILRYHQRLLRAIYNIRELKCAQRRLADASVTLVEMNREQKETCNILGAIRLKQREIEDRVSNLDTKLDAIDKKLSVALQKIR